MTPDPTLSRLLSDRIVLACRAQLQTAHSLARLLVELVDGGHLRALGYATLAEYADTALDLDPRVARDLLRIGRKLDELPVIDAAMSSGHLSWTKARELVRFATADTEAAWVQYASVRTSRVLEREVAHVGRGTAPPTEGVADGVTERDPARRRVVFPMEATDAEVLFRALALLRARAGLDTAEAEDGALLAALARRVIHEEEEADAHSGAPDGGGDAVPHAASGERYRVVLEHCPDCRETHTRTHGGEAEVSDTITAEAACDAEIVEMRPGPNQGHRTRSIPPATRRIVLHRAGWRCEIPGCRNSLWLDLHHVHGWARGGEHALSNLAVVCSTHHRAIHAGVLAVERLETGSMRVMHYDGRAQIGPAARARLAHVGA
ncbi:MAG: HNH endonuclease signature motif containing protein [Pseudomonadota bacterium]|nr:HNH endonuclease signature motif containing protein [Pseudomonadota bacterium]